ncbi:cupin domain-containing protein [Dactylosporangium sp. NPDC049742]|uniref:cupin domain-containing protein n=1 Tax=Dactylosporangium sp. NPDC049742 TaxID=3154737 RepID=UPI00341DE629
MRDTARRATIMTPVDINQLAWVPVDACRGVHVKQLGEEDGCVAALIAYQPGATTPGLAHPEAQHHIWVVSGQASVAGRRLRAGGYAHVPEGSVHPIEAGTSGCVLLQLYIPYRARHAAMA